MKKILFMLVVLALITSVYNPTTSTAEFSPTDTPTPALPSPPTISLTVTTPPLNPTSTEGAPPTSAPITPDIHPHLWLTPATVDSYRAWANVNNLLWQQGLAPLAARAKSEMDRGLVPGQDCGDVYSEVYPTEMYAELFAFLSLIDPDETARADYATRARTLLMHIMNEAVKGPAAQADYLCNGRLQYPPFRHPDFFTTDRDRPRYHGEAYALTVDWIYPSLTDPDKATIRNVFLQWSESIVTRGYHHPEPVGLLNDPRLLSDTQQVRWSGNNYYTAHMRNLGLMAMALSPQDDPGGQLRKYLDTATGAYLYIFNHFTATDARGGLLPEGLEYSPQTASYATQFLWAMQTAQIPNADQFVDQAFWNSFITAYLHFISPVPAVVNVGGEMVSAYQPSWYGDAQNYFLPDFIDVFSALAHVLNNAEPSNALRWIEINTALGGLDRLRGRVGNPDDFRSAILYFLLLNPNAPAPSDPRPALPLDDFVSGLGRIYSRSGWDANASWFTYRLGWNSVDHQLADGNHFEFYRKGEWLTKGRSGYADTAEGIASSEFYNTLCIANDRPDRDESDWRIDLWKRGSQWNYVSAGNPQLIAHSFNPAFTYATGDATNLYNSAYENVTDVSHASRSIVWLKPDHAIVYDRAETKSSGRFKRWWLELAQPATVNGNQATAHTAGGQQLLVTVLLPSGATLQAINTTEQHIVDTTAIGETMSNRLMTEASGNPQAVRFLHVLQGADAGVNADAVALVQSDDGLWEGAAVHGAVILFARVLGQTLSTSLAYTAPAGVTKHIITGLTPGASYNTRIETISNGLHVVVTPGTQVQADSGGVLMLSTSGVLTITVSGPGPALVNPVTVTYSVQGCSGREMFLVLNAPAMGIPWAYLGIAGWVPLPANLAEITPYASGPADGTYTLFVGTVPAGSYDLYLGCDFVSDGHLNIDTSTGLNLNGVYDHFSVTVQ